MRDHDNRRSIDELRALEGQVTAMPADANGAVVILKDGILAVIRAAIAAEAALGQQSEPRRLKASVGRLSHAE